MKDSKNDNSKKPATSTKKTDKKAAETQEKAADKSEKKPAEKGNDKNQKVIATPFLPTDRRDDDPEFEDPKIDDDGNPIPEVDIDEDEPMVGYEI